MREPVSVLEFSFYAFCKVTEELINKGYRFDFEDNLRFPTGNLGSYSAIMVDNQCPLDNRQSPLVDNLQDPIVNEGEIRKTQGRPAKAKV